LELRDDSFDLNIYPFRFFTPVIDQYIVITKGAAAVHSTDWRSIFFAHGQGTTIVLNEQDAYAFAV